MRAYQTCLREHEEMNAQLMRLQESSEKMRNPDRWQNRIMELNQLQYDKHQELNVLGLALGKSEHEIRKELLAFRFGGREETKIPGMIILPYAEKANEDDSDPIPLDVDEVDLNRPWFHSDSGDDSNLVQPKNGYLFLISMENYASGDGQSISWKDANADVKKKRMADFVTDLQQDLPSLLPRLVTWTGNDVGGYHNVSHTEYTALFIEDNEAETALEQVVERIKASPEKYWLTQEEIKEWSHKVIRSTFDRYIKETDLLPLLPESTEGLKAKAIIERQLVLEQMAKKMGQQLGYYGDEPSDDPLYDLGIYFRKKEVLDADKTVLEETSGFFDEKNEPMTVLSEHAITKLLKIEQEKVKETEDTMFEVWKGLSEEKKREFQASFPEEHTRYLEAEKNVESSFETDHRSSI